MCIVEYKNTDVTGKEQSSKQQYHQRKSESLHKAHFYLYCLYKL